MISSLEVPLVTLMREIASTVNSSQFNVTGLREKMQLAVELTLHAAQQVRLFFLTVGLFTVTFYYVLRKYNSLQVSDHYQSNSDQCIPLRDLYYCCMKLKMTQCLCTYIVFTAHIHYRWVGNQHVSLPENLIPV